VYGNTRVSAAALNGRSKINSAESSDWLRIKQMSFATPEYTRGIRHPSRQQKFLGERSPAIVATVEQPTSIVAAAATAIVAMRFMVGFF
jgi:hypothetical protein